MECSGKSSGIGVEAKNEKKHGTGTEASTCETEGREGVRKLK